MSRYVLIGISGEAGLRLIDLESGSVQAIAPDAVDESVAQVRSSGATVLRGVDVAIALPNRDEAVGRFFFDGGAVR